MNDGGEAFPTETGSEFIKGMTLRDYFAAKAIPMMLTLWEGLPDDYKMLYSGCEDSGLIFARDFPNLVAKQSYRIADAMLKAREPKQE